MSRRHSREISSISLSALDLFCCALGAFIILTVVTLQYVPNLAPEELYQKLKQAEDQAQSAEAENETLKEQIKSLENSLKANRSDIMIAVDTTASMGTEVELIRNEIGKLVLILRKMSNDTRIGFVDYKDSRCGEPEPFRTLPLTKVDDAGLGQINKFLARMQAQTNCTGNNEPPEALYEAFQKSVVADWQVPPMDRVILLIGDNPPYSDQEAVLIERARQFAAQGGHVSTRFTNDARTSQRSEQDLKPIKEYYSTVANAGNGVAVTSDEGGFALSILLSIAK